MFKEAAQVGDRLRIFRINLDLTQSEFAAEVGVTRERLANYEEGRTPLKVETALDICSSYTCSEKWLAIGEGDSRMSMNLSYDPACEKLHGMFFPEAFRTVLSARYEALFAETPHQIRFAPFGNDCVYDRRVLGSFLFGWERLLGDEKSAALMAQIIAVGNKFCIENMVQESLPNPRLLEQAEPGETLAFVAPIIYGAQQQASGKNRRKSSR